MATNRSYRSFIIKLLVALLASTMIWWGVSSDLLRGPSGHRDWVIKVGDIKYTAQEWDFSLRAVAHSSPIAGTKENTAALREQVLQELVDAALILQEAHRMGFLVSDEMAKHEIKVMPAFRGSDGNFNPELVTEAIRLSGLSELAFLQKIKEQIARQQLLDFFYNTKRILPSQFLDIVIPVIGAKNTIKLYKITDSLVQKQKPDEETVRTFWKDHPENFTMPERRLVSYAVIKGNSMTTPQKQVTEDEIAALYAKIDKQNIPEKREFQQLLFSNQKEAEAKYQELQRNPQRFGTYLRQHKQAIPANFGPVTAHDLAPQLTDKLFALNLNNITAPIQTPLGWHIFKLHKLVPAHVQSLEELKPLIIAQLQEQNNAALFNQLLEEIEAKKEHTSFDEIAKEYKIPTKQQWVTAPTPLSDNADTASNKDPYDPEFVSAVFSTPAQSLTNTASASPSSPWNAVALPESRAIMLYQIDKVEEPHLISFEESKSKAEMLWSVTNNMHQKQAIAADVKRILSGTNLGFAGVANSEEAQRKELLSKIDTQALTFNILQIPESLPASLRKEVLNMQPGQVSSVFTAPNGDCWLAQLTGLNYNIPKDEAEKYKSELSGQIAGVFSDILFQGYLRSLREKYPIEIKRELISSSEY